MRKLFTCAIFLLIVLTAASQKINFIEQVGIGYSSGVKANTFSPSGNSGGFSFESTGDFMVHNLIGLGFGFDINVVKMNNINQSLSPFFADFKLVGKGRFKPYVMVDPGFSLFYASANDGVTQKASFYMGGGAGLWFPSKRLLHLFLQGKYNYTKVSTSTNGYSANIPGSLQTVNFLVGYKF